MTPNSRRGAQRRRPVARFVAGAVAGAAVLWGGRAFAGARIPADAARPLQTSPGQASLRHVGRAAVQEAVVPVLAASHEALASGKVQSTDGKEVVLTELWKGEEKAVVVLLRHFG